MGAGYAANHVSNIPIILERIDPGESLKVRFRWDPVENAGDHELHILADPNDQISELDEGDNISIVPLHVRQKANLVIEESDVSLTLIDTQYRLDFVVRNKGDIRAERVQAVVSLKRRGIEDFVTMLLPLSPGATETIEPGAAWINSNLKFRLPDLEWVEIEADPEGVVDEETHDDNHYRISPN